MDCDPVLDEIRCARPGCGHRYLSDHGLVDHRRGGGPCLVGSRWDEELCGCDGFLWVDPTPAPPAPLRAPAGEGYALTPRATG